jgi:NADPH:quinone reductase
MPTPIPKTMRFIEITSFGGPERLALTTGPVPQPGAGEVLIQVEAAGLNRADLLQRQGHYPPPAGASPILGMEVSGHIAALGTGDCGAWQVGSPVCALIAGGGYAEYCVAPAAQCMTTPRGLGLTECAAIPEAAITVWANLFEAKYLSAGDLFLMQGGTSGIGTMAIQAARCFDAHVVTTAGTDEKCEFARGLGAEKAINYRTEDWPAEVAKWCETHSGKTGVDVILDMVGGDYFAKHLQLLATGGRLINIAFLGGSRLTVDLRVVMMKRLVITGSTLRGRSVKEKKTLVSNAGQALWPFFESGQIKPIVARVFPFAEAAEAHRWMETGEHIGKIVLQVAQ